MHHALLVEEILLNIFRYCHSWPPHRSRHSSYASVHPVALAGTCRAFKEPALDMIWAELNDLTPLVRCLPSESWATCEPTDPNVKPLYSLRKPLEQEDWDILLGYTHRVRGLPRLRGSSGLTVDCIQALSYMPGSARSESIFPNLRVVGLYEPSATIAPLIQHLISPTVTEISLQGAETSGSTIEDFGRGCPFVSNFCVSQWAHNDMIFGLIRHWQDLHTVLCLSVGLHIDTIRHLSCLHDLRRLSFKVHDAVVDQIQAASIPNLTFLVLRDLYLRSPFLTPIGRLLHQLRIPILNTLAIALDACPTSPDLMSSFSAVQGACTHAYLEGLSFRVYENDDETTTLPAENSYHITFDRLRPLTIFVNIKTITLDIPCGVDLSERQLLTLASSWPRLETFELSPDYDWTPSSAITLRGFLQLLEQCRSLRVFYFTFDTRGYTEIPQGHPWRGLRMPKDTFIHMLNSPIEETSVEALGVFFHVAPYPDFNLTTHWGNQYHRGSERPPELCDLYYDRWVRARDLARELWEKRRDLAYSLEAPDSASHGEAHRR